MATDSFADHYVYMYLSILTFITPDKFYIGLLLAADVCFTVAIIDWPAYLCCKKYYFFNLGIMTVFPEVQVFINLFYLNPCTHAYYIRNTILLLMGSIID